MKLLKRYRFFMLTIIVILVVTAFNNDLGIKALSISGFSFREMALILPPIFVLMGLLDVWVPRETMVRFMGEGSGLKGVLLSIFLGSAAAGPLYGAFPVAAVFMKKGVSFRNVLIFLGAWSTTKIPMFLFEMSALGAKFAVTRLLISIPGIILISHILASVVSQTEVKVIFEKAKAF